MLARNQIVSASYDHEVARKPRMPWPISSDHRYSVLIFLAAFAVFVLSPVHPIADSKYSMLVTQSLIDHGTFHLNNYYIPRNKRPKNPENIPRQSVLLYKYPYQIEIINKKFYYFFPPGTSVLSIPFVYVSNLAGIEVAKKDGSYNVQGEKAIQRFASSFLMAILGVVFYQTARMLHNSKRSLLFSFAALFGTQVWSTASRGMQSHTWNILLTGLLIYLITSHEIKNARLKPVLIGTILPWMYFVRPTSIIPVSATLLYFLIYHRGSIPRLILTFFGWFALFVAYSWHNFGQTLPNYYASGRLIFHDLWPNFCGLLISPSRGLFIYVPILIFVFYQLARRFKDLKFHRLIYLSLLTTAGHFLVVSAFPKWWGGHCYGPRLITDLVPWFFLIAIIVMESYERHLPSFSYQHWRQKAGAFAAAVLLIMSVAINGYGALSITPWIWNSSPNDIDFHTERLWDWENPQFLFGILQ